MEKTLVVVYVPDQYTYKVHMSNQLDDNGGNRILQVRIALLPSGFPDTPQP